MPEAARPEGGLSPEQPRHRNTLLAAIAFVNGAVVMVVEIASARAMAPYFGGSLLVWSSVIGVTLGALALGYALGGRIADRSPRLEWLGAALGAGAFFTAGIPLWGGPLMLALMRLDLVAGILLASTLLLVPPLTAFGAVSPILVRRAAQTIEGVGRTTGNLFAISTLGGVVGALAAGLWLCPVLGTRMTCLAAASLAGLAALPCLLLRRRSHAAALVLLIGVGVPVVAGAVHLPVLSGAGVRIVHRADSISGQVRVVDFDERRALVVDGIGQSAIDRTTGVSYLEYTHLLSAPASGLPERGRVLILGLGGGSIARQILRARPDLRVTACELDEEIVRVARAHFDLPAACDVRIEDGRRLLRQMSNEGAAFEYVVIDLFSGEREPWYVFTREAFEEVRSTLAPGGLLGINFFGVCKPGDTRAIASLLSTLESAGFRSNLYPAQPEDPEGNIVLFSAIEAPPDPSIRIVLDRLSDAERSSVEASLSHPLRFEVDGPVNTDDRCELDLLLRPHHEAWRRAAGRQAQAGILTE